MGKDLRGKELGVGISQRKDGLYTARYTAKDGKRKQAYFKKLQECRNWIADAQFEKEHGNVLFSENPTVDAWYRYWIDDIKGDNIRYNTRLFYETRYEKSIKPHIGQMLIKEVKPLHCQNVLNEMGESYKNSVISSCRTLMWSIFDSAVENELLPRNPVTKSVKCTSGRKSEERLVLTREKQKIFLETMEGTKHYNQYALVLQTGLRVGELVGLRWNDIDFKNCILYVKRNAQYRSKEKKWYVGDLKTKNGYRSIPLTREAIKILKSQREKAKKVNVVSVEWAGTVFLNDNGMPIIYRTYDENLARYWETLGVRGLSMHTLRHTFATRCIEGGMKPKTLQKIMGHSNIATTMNLYVHVTDEEKAKEVEGVERMLKLV